MLRSYGIQDFKFKNNTRYPIYIRSAAGSGGLTVNIYGHLDFKQNISINHVVDQVIGFEEFTQMKNDLDPGTVIIEQKGQTGYRSRAFRNFSDKKGQIIKTEQYPQTIISQSIKLYLPARRCPELKKISPQEKGR